MNPIQKNRLVSSYHLAPVHWSSVVVLWLGLCVASLTAQTNPPLQWKPLYDPGVGGWVTSLSIHPTNPSIVLVGGDILGVGRSADGGVSWDRPNTPTGSYMMEEFTWHPASGDSSSPHYGEVWVGTRSGPWKSTDFGLTWVSKSIGMPQHNGGVNDYRPAIQKVLVDPGNAERLLAFFGAHRGGGSGTYYGSGQVWVSTDDGENWAVLATVATDASTVNCLINTAAYQFTGTGGATTLFAASRKGFYKSADNGATWTQKSSGLPAANGNIRALAVHPTDGHTLWISIAAGGVFKSTDAGETWAAANTGFSSPATGTFDALVVSPADANLLFTTKVEDHKLYRSTDGAATWTLQPSEAYSTSPYPIYKDVHCFAAHPTQAGVIFAGTATDIWKTTNGSAADDLDGVAPYTGPFWTNVSSVPAGSGWAGTGYSGQVVNQFRWNPYNTAEAAMAAMDGGKFVTRDTLQTWTFGGGGRGKGLNDWYGFIDFSFSSVSGSWYALQGQVGNYNSLNRTTNAGTTWTTIATPSVGGVAAAGNPTVVVSHPTNTSRVWVAWGGKLYYSASAGSSGSWVQLASDSTTFGTITELVSDPNDATGNTLWYGGSKGLFRSTDGSNFAQIAPTGTALDITRIRLDPTTTDRVWIVNAAHSRSNSYSTGLWRLTVSTGSWACLAAWGNPSSPVKYIVDVDVDPTNGNRIAVGTSQDNYTAITSETGVWINDNNGASDAWRREVTGLGVQRVRTVSFRPGTSQLVAGTMGGGYYIADTNGNAIDLSPAPASFSLVATADAEVRRTGAGDGGGTVADATSTQLFIGNPNSTGISGISPVYAFQLPDVGAVVNPFTTATFTVGLTSSATGYCGYNADVYGLPAGLTPDILPEDAFCGATDATDATKLQDNWIGFNSSTKAATGVKTLSNAALVSYLNAQYAGGAGAGWYVFIRISPDNPSTSYKNERFGASENSDATVRPTLIFH